jgi:hypothetical protein
LLSFLSGIIPEEVEQSQQHIETLKRYQTDVESKKLSYSHGQRLFNIKVSDIDEEKATILAHETFEDFHTIAKHSSSAG